MGDDGKAVSFHYCGRLCQQKDWPQHKELCNRLRARRELQRAAETLQQIWHAFRAELFPYAPPIKLEERDGVLYLYDEPDPAARGWQLGPFPDDVAKEERDRKAVLVLYTCAVAVGCLDGTIRLFLKGESEKRDQRTRELYRDCLANPLHLSKRSLFQTRGTFLLQLARSSDEASRWEWQSCGAEHRALGCEGHPKNK